jgi:hypothetical protein
MAELKNFTGGCHCGQVRFDVTADLSHVIECNCSICIKRGALMTFVTADRFALRAGSDDLTDYQFNKKVLHHPFCKYCGVGAFSQGKSPDGRDMVAVNVRCLDGVDIKALSLTGFDGKNL